MTASRRSRTLFVIAAVAIGARGAAGAAPAPLEGRAVYVADSTEDRLIRLIDRDGSGLVEPESSGELTVFYDDSSPGPDLSTPSALLAGPDGEVILLDGGTLDAVYVLVDRDGDGTANGEGEWRVFYDDSSPGPDLSTPGALAAGRAGTADAGAVFIADDGATAGRIIRVQDLDGDGSANGADEWRVVYDKTALSPAEGVLKDLEALAVLPDGRLLASESTLGRIIALHDANGDGDFLDLEETVVHFDPQGVHPFAQLQGLAVGPAGEAMAADAESGLVVRLRDLDGDGTAMGPGEASAYLDPALPPALGDVGDLTVDSGVLVILDRSRDAVLLSRDLDGDGRGGGEGETFGWLADGGASLTTPSAVAVGAAPDAPPPQVRVVRVDPASGPATGGTRVRIEGTFPRFETATVTIGGSPAAVIAAGASSIECATPLGREGPAEVRVATAAGEGVLPGGFTYQPATVLFLRADGNADGKTDLSDAVSTLGFLFLGGPAPSCRDALDADDDGLLSISDPIFLLSYLFQGGAAIPPPHPTPGADPTQDALSCAGA